MKRVLVVMDEVVAGLLKRGAPRASEAGGLPIGVALGGEVPAWKLDPSDGHLAVLAGEGAVPGGRRS